jgi:DHA1 family inner membrane transport protein
LLAARFLAGLPHGAYFGVASVVAATLAGPSRRAWAVARVLLGLTVANVVGVPAATWLGQALGWRSAFIAVGAIGVLTMLALVRWLPSIAMSGDSSLRTEVRALGRAQVWLTLAIAAIGFGGMFAVYSYITPTLTNLAGMNASRVPLVLAVWGVGMVVGNLVGGWLADRGAMRAMAIALVATALSLALFSVTSSNAIAATATAFLLGSGLAIAPALQLRLMDLAPDAQSLTAALMHSAFNAANAIGPWLGGMVIAAGFGWRAPSWVGVGLALGGLGILGTSLLLERTTRRRIALVGTTFAPRIEPTLDRASAA